MATKLYNNSIDNPLSWEPKPAVIEKSLEEMESNLKDMDCEMFFEWNNKLDAWNGYLRRIGDEKGFIKAFVYNHKEESACAALNWAIKYPRQLKFYTGKREA